MDYKFKVGDQIRLKYDHKMKGVIKEIKTIDTRTLYILDNGFPIRVEHQDKYELLG